MPFYQTLPKAEITCLDYSPDMMAQAKEKADRLGVQNVSFRQGDVSALPFEDGLPRQGGGLPRDLPGAAPRRNVLRLLLRVGRVPADGPAHPARI